MKKLTELASWNELQKEAKNLREKGRAEALYLNENAKSLYIKSMGFLTFDFSKQMINSTIMDLLVRLANDVELGERIENLMSGKKVNVSEHKAALHTALRDFETSSLLVDGLNIMSEVDNTREQIKRISNLIRTKKWLGYSGTHITDVVNIGIGGSDLGPRFCINALDSYCSKDLNYYFISDADPDGFDAIIKLIDPQTTLFIISSKSFTTKETLINAHKVIELYPSQNSIQQHFIAITAHPKRAQQLGIKTILPIWDWVGGRYSFCSAVNLITAIAIGYEQFTQLLIGAHQVDQHVHQTDFKNNIPVLMALLGIWNINFLNIHNLLILAYSKRLEYFIPYLQQLDMESNGKSIDINGKRVAYATGPIVWGGLGNQAQHSYFQLLCQGTHKSAVDFITLQTNDKSIINEMCDYKMKVLSEGIESVNNPNGFISGNVPLNHIKLSDCSPFSLGALVSLYEHKIFIQSVIWNINPFDQPGVESAKLLGNFSTALS
ncbi:glucose-6-phosphate isomerase [Legionella bononiensis]|uniref:Glucose-6-phosphate isomerase n=1 Tax=Legionella bononiensis TaxID=2793102 RepID=A0ABS1W7W3_9GAMM|nr:glucose-6-phosphate isomerase [Legionella bononiensis]MBL7480034.1 glucose-6-phosphate isomerase [Legionella bononiensis]MBL7525452.1 glucose-6-phosphate isomerase [Legionella bononiensis]MBL7561635.1 glucose-6-phosphate isomerase [Legionella bononiensis]